MERRGVPASRPTREPSDLWRSLGLALMLASPAILIVGSHAVREVPGKDFTPFQVAGPLFVLIVLPVYPVLGYRGAWRAGLALVAAYQLALAVLVFRWVGALAGSAILAVNVAVVSAILLADRSEPG